MPHSPQFAKQWPLHSAAQGGKGSSQLLERLLGTEASLTEADRYNGKVALTDTQRQELLDAKETRTGRTALHYAVSTVDMTKEGSTRPAQTLLQHGADVFAVDKDGRTPLDLALSFRDWEHDPGRLQVVSMLRSAVDVAWSKGRRPIPWSARHPWDPGYKEHHPLHEACCRDDMIATQRLLGPVPQTSTASLTPPQSPRALDEEDFDEPTSKATDQLEAPNAYGQTPLLVAAGNGSSRVATLLLKHGADVNAKDANGKTALDLARVNNNENMVSLLLEDSERTAGTGQGNGVPVLPQAEVTMAEQENEEVESEGEDPIVVALAKAAAAVAKADADEAAETAASAAPTDRSRAVVFGIATLGKAGRVRADGSRAAGSLTKGAHIEPTSAAADVSKKAPISGDFGAVMQVSAYADAVRKKREKLDKELQAAPPSLSVVSSGSRKAKSPDDRAAQADQIVQAHLENLEKRREAMRWDADIDQMVEEKPEYGAVRVCGAVDIPQADSFSDNDLYAIVIWNDKEVGRTRCIRDDNSPIWDESFDLRINHGVNTLRVEVWEQDTFPQLGESSVDCNSQDEFIGCVVLEGASSGKLPRKITSFALAAKAENGKGGNSAGRSTKSKSGSSRSNDKDNGLGLVTMFYTPKPPTPASDRRAHRNKTRSSVPLPLQDLLKEQLLDTRRLDFTFCGLDSCKGIAAVAAKYAIPTWTSTNTKRAKKSLQNQIRGQMAANVLTNSVASATSSNTAVVMPPVVHNHGHAHTIGSLPAHQLRQKQQPQSPRGRRGVYKSPRTERARGTNGKAVRGGRTHRVRHEANEPNCLYDTFGWLTTRQRKEVAAGKNTSDQQNPTRHALVDSITLANNELHSLAHFQVSIEPFLAQHTTRMLQHLDLSCNRLTSLYIFPEGADLVAYMKEQQRTSDAHRSSNAAAQPRVSALAGLPNLHTLYLHVNALRSPRELDAIAEYVRKQRETTQQISHCTRLTRLNGVTCCVITCLLLAGSGDANAIAMMGMLHRLKVLRNLSLHGNPLEENFSSLSGPTHRNMNGGTNNGDAAPRNGAAPNAATEASGYRLSVIAKIPWLRKLDFVTVTKGERFEIASEANKLSARGLRRRQRLLERGASPPGQPHRSGTEISGTHKLVHTLQRMHLSTATGEPPAKIAAKSVIDTGRN